MPSPKRADESQTAYTIRRIREEALEEVRGRVMSLVADVSALAPEHKVGFRAGHAAARAEARDIITEMLGEQ